MILRSEEVQHYARIYLSGGAGAGKTHAAAELASRFANFDPDKIIWINNEGYSGFPQLLAQVNASHYKFDSITLPDCSINGLSKAMQEIKRVGKKYEAMVIDSYSMFYNGTGGITEAVNGVQKAWMEIGNPQDFFRQSVVSNFEGHAICLGRTKFSSDGNEVIEDRDNYAYPFKPIGVINQNHSVSFQHKHNYADLLKKRIYNDSLSEEFLDAIVNRYIDDFDDTLLNLQEDYDITLTINGMKLMQQLSGSMKSHGIPNELMLPLVCRILKTDKLKSIRRLSGRQANKVIKVLANKNSEASIADFLEKSLPKQEVEKQEDKAEEKEVEEVVVDGTDDKSES